MGDGDTMTQARRPQALPGKETVCDQRTTQTMEILEQQASFFKSSLFASGINMREHLICGQNGGKTVHIWLGIMHPSIDGHKKAAQFQSG